MALITAAEFNVCMDRLRDAARRGVLTDPAVGTLPVQARLLTERIIKLTPAKTEDQQRRAIRNDLLNIFQIHRPALIDLAVRKFGTGRVDGWLHDERRGIHVYLSGAGLAPDVAAARRIHHANYTVRGRTRRLAGSQGSLGEVRKGFKFLISPAVFAAYLKEAYLLIGRAKAGWLPGAHGVGVRNIPGYVARHAPGEGFFINGLNAERPFVEIRNTTRWAKYREEGARIVNSAIGSRIRAMDTYLKKQAELAVKRAGLS